jgi:hypothetical protein
MTQIHPDFAVPSPRKRTWFVRGFRPDGSRWESGERHPTREKAIEEMGLWASCDANAGTMKIYVHLPLK